MSIIFLKKTAPFQVKKQAAQGAAYGGEWQNAETQSWGDH